MGIVLFLIIGIVAGWLAGKITKGSGFGLMGDMIVGVIGAFVGGFIFSIFGIVSVSMIGTLITSTIGAVVFLFLISLIPRR